MKNEKLIIRPMIAEDLTAASVLYANVYAKVDIGERWTEKSAKQLLKYWISKQPDLSFVALIGNKIVGGFMAGIKPWWDGNHLVDGEIFVDYLYHKRGIGTKLSKALYKIAIKKYKIASVDFITFSKNGFPLSWYESTGFKVNRHLTIINGVPTEIMKKLGESFK